MSYEEIQRNIQNQIKFEDGINIQRLDAIFRLLKNKSGKLLDVGCSEGKFIIEYQKKGFECEGIDISDKAIENGKRRGLDIKKVDITQKLPYKDETFDIICCGQVLEHVLDPLPVVRDMHRILKKNGNLIITVPNINMFRNLFLILLGKPLAYSCRFDSPHYRDFCKTEAIRILKKGGFKNIKITGDKLNIPYWKGKLIRLTPYIPRFCDNLVLRGTK
ncbi:class I SAM-dependent methyltransferase [Candidatus Woesearchaeota archaeon]|nr:class I SAM-dependent methyltransferase [Candidatus Woesearchaeota archaeon]